MIAVLAPAGEEAALLARGEHHEPHRILGAHAVQGGTVVRAFHPEAVAVTMLTRGSRHEMEPLGDGLWASRLEGVDAGDLRHQLIFRFRDGAVWERDDPYRFPPTLGDLDLHLIGEGTHERLYDVLGAHPRTVEGVDGVAFAVWAPGARAVRLTGEFNGWDSRLLPMRSLGSSGVWELFVPGIGAGSLYKYDVLGSDGVPRLKTDPLAFSMEIRPQTASRVWQMDGFEWHDDDWIEERARRDAYRSPMAIYEVHLGSWMRDANGGWLGYRDVAPRLAEHCRRYGFTHLEFLPLAEHPFDASWGYQVTGYYAPTSRFGTPDDLRHMIDELHRAGIGVILDWVPAHFPRDEFALARFDGTGLYEHEDPRLGAHPDWGTLIFNYGRNEVRNFLVANALFWLDAYHVDGLRVDAVASMLYLDYSRKSGEWIPNRFGGNENIEAISFLREVNERCYGRFPGIVMVAEESTAFGGVTRPTHLGGLGFGFKWDMGWMHDTLAYFSHDPIHRRYHHDRLTFRGLYLGTEHFVLPLSHDEVVHGKGSLLGKMPGDDWQRFANLRALLAQMYTQPGKKLLFMGTELAPWQEWDHEAALPWQLGDEPMHAAFGRYLVDLAAVYRSTPALWRGDRHPDGFAWIDATDVESSVFSYLRRECDEDPASLDGADRNGVVAVVLNLTPIARYAYRVGLPSAGRWEEILNSDSSHYGGSNQGNLGGIDAEERPFHGQPASALLTLPPLAALILRPVR